MPGSPGSEFLETGTCGGRSGGRTGFTKLSDETFGGSMKRVGLRGVLERLLPQRVRMRCCPSVSTVSPPCTRTACLVQ